MSNDKVRGRMAVRISASYPDSDSFRSALSLRSELRLVEILLNLSKRCLSPKLKSHATELYARKVRLKQELKIRSEAEKANPSLFRHRSSGRNRTISFNKVGASCLIRKSSACSLGRELISR